MNPAAQQLVDSLLESPVIRVCAHCEKELGIPHVQPGIEKTHGICERHYYETLRGIGFSDEAIRQRLAGRVTDFCKDLKDEQRPPTP